MLMEYFEAFVEALKEQLMDDIIPDDPELWE